MLQESGPMYFLVITDTGRIDAGRERTLYADFIRALDPAVSEENAARIAGTLLDDAEPIFGSYEIMAVEQDPWRYQYMRCTDPDGDPPMLTVMPRPEQKWEPPKFSFGEAERLAGEVYARFRALCGEAGVQLLPDVPAEPDFSDPDLVLMTHVVLDTAEWSSIYSDGCLIAYSLCVHKDTPAYDSVVELMPFAALAEMVDYTLDEAQALIDEARANMEDAGDGMRVGNAGGFATTLIVSEDEIRQALIVVFPSKPVEGIPERPDNQDVSRFDVLERVDADAYPAFRSLCEENGLSLLPEAPETTADSEESVATTVSRRLLEDAEWCLWYRDGELWSVVLSITTDTDFGERDLKLYVLFVRAVFGLDEQEATAALAKAIQAGTESADGVALFPVEGERFSGSLSSFTTGDGYMLIVSPFYAE